jgi:E3 ubiquitin-protein ligase HUWE1
LKEQIDLFADCPQEELASQLAAFTRWDYPKGDLHQWIRALDRFDDILEYAVKNHGFREGLKVQQTPFPPDMKICLCQIMRVTALLFGNCSYRTIYGSASVIHPMCNI